MDELPELPFEKVLSYLSLEDRLKARAVSRSWYHRINSIRVSSLCFAERPLGLFILRNHGLINGIFVQNFIFSTKFASFFNAFGPSILSNLRRLRICDLKLDNLNAAVFAQTLNSFGQLTELGLFNFCPKRVTELELNLPILTSLQIKRVNNIQLTLDAPRLRKVRTVNCNLLNLVIVHGESVERLLTDRFGYTEVKNLKNLQHIYSRDSSPIDSTLLSGLDQLKEIHTMNSQQIANLFEQKQRYGRTDLKIYLCGLYLNGPDDPIVHSLHPYFAKDTFVQLAENPSRLADEIPFLFCLKYSEIKRADPEVEIDFVSRFTNFSHLIVEPVEDIERFLGLLNKFPNIVNLTFRGAQPRDLFDRLPEHSAVQTLTIPESALSGLEFLRRLEHLHHLHVGGSLDAEQIRNFFELPFLLLFSFGYNNELARIEVIRDSGCTYPRGYEVSWGSKRAEVPDLEAAIQFIFGTAPQENAQLQ